MKSILVRAPNWIGDQVLAFPFFHYLRQAYPRARIASVCVEWVKDIQFLDLVDEVHVLPRAVRGGAWERFQLLNRAGSELQAKGPWELAISLPNSLSAAWLLKRAGASRRRGYKVEGRGILLNDGVPWNPAADRHRAQAYVDLLPSEARPGRPVREFWGTPPATELDTFEPGELESFAPERSWPGADPIDPPGEPYWVLAPGATADSRRWPVEYFTSLARRIASETGMKGVVIGGPKEAPLAAQLCEDRESKLLDRVAQGPVPSLWKIFRGARFTVTNESGLAHVAALCGSSVQVVCGAADPRRTRPLGPGKVQVAINPVECWPCERNTCLQPPEKRIQCLRGIQPDTVWEEIKRGIRSEAPG